MEDSKPISTPMVTCSKPSKDDEPTRVSKKLYRYMIVSLLYVIVTRIDIMQAHGVVAIFQPESKETYLQVVNKMHSYLKGKLEFVIWYPKVKNFTLTTYIDAY